MKIKLLFIVLFSFILLSCEEEVGVTKEKMSGEEATLPDELKGLKVYTVSLGGGDYVKVAVLNNVINSTTYSVGKIQEATIIINNSKYERRTIYADEILSETDDIIVIRKK